MNKKIVVGISTFLLVSVAIYFVGQELNTQQKQVEEKEVATQKADSLAILEAKVEPKKLFGFTIDSMVIVQDKIKFNENLSEILSKFNVGYQDVHQLAIQSKKIFDVRKIAANKPYTLICYPDSLHTAKAFVYEPNKTEYVVFHLEDSMLIEKIQRKITVHERSLTGTIHSSLSKTMDDLNITQQLTNDMVDVLGWQIDFFRLQKGDRFKIVYDEKLIDGEVVGIGGIKAVQFEHFGNDFFAYAYDQGEGIDYFDEEGHSLRKALLKYPLEFSRISSRYSLKRFHPVQKRWKSHLGTDFAAARGTPIRTVGDGIITEAKYKRANGNYVKVKHNGTYTTQYLHMSKIASGIKAGGKVKQGQVIGYVGSTGLATGNHLCYRFWKNGVQVDALRVKLPPASPIKEEAKDAFNLAVQSHMSKLQNIPFAEPEEPLMASAQ